MPKEAIRTMMMFKHLVLATVVILSGCITPDDVPVPPSTTLEYDINVLLTPHQISPPVKDSEAIGKFSLDLETYQYIIKLHGFDFDKNTPAPTPLTAQLHCAKATANGPVVYELDSGGWKPNTHNTYTATGMIVTDYVLDSNSNSACSFWVRNLDDLREALDAGELYVVIHSLEHPAGEVRGQIFITGSK